MINWVLKPTAIRQNTYEFATESGVTTDDQLVADCCYECFSSVASNLDMDIPITVVEPLSFITSQSSSSVCLPTHPGETASIILSCKNDGKNHKGHSIL